MDQRSAAVAVMAKMALMDGGLEAKERELLESLLGEGPVIDRVLEYARSLPLSELISHVASYEDRFVMAYRAFSMGSADGDFDIAELRLFNHLVRALEVTPDDRELIIETHRRLAAERPQDPDPRVMEIYRASSFFEQDG